MRTSSSSLLADTERRRSAGAACHRGRGQHWQQEVALTENCQFWFEDAIISRGVLNRAGDGGTGGLNVCRAPRPPALILDRHCLGTQAERETIERGAQLCCPGICFPISRPPSSTKAHLCTCAPRPSLYWFPAPFPFSSSKACKWLRAARDGGAQMCSPMAGSLGRLRLLRRRL